MWEGDRENPTGDLSAAGVRVDDRDLDEDRDKDVDFDEDRDFEIDLVMDGDFVTERVDETDLTELHEPYAAWQSLPQYALVVPHQPHLLQQRPSGHEPASPPHCPGRMTPASGPSGSTDTGLGLGSASVS
jgi:hypothetical protein